jgi:hypothetical protein
MAKKSDFQDYICRPFCMFYREGKKENLACQGAKVIEQLLKKGLVSRAQFRQYKKDSDKRWARDPFLEQRICNPCLFRKEDCDFQSESQPPYAEPCGGYILLTLLKENGRLSFRDLEETIKEW